MLTLSKPPPVEGRPPVPVIDTGWPPQPTELLAEVDRLLRAGRPQEAVDAIGDTYLVCPWTANALAVCHLRLGSTAAAVRHLRYIATDHASAALRDDVPVVFQTNLATALLADGDLEGFLSTLDQLAGVDHPSVRRLQAETARWEEALSGCERLLWSVSGVLLRRPRLDSPPGELIARPGGVPPHPGHPQHGLLSAVGVVGGTDFAAGDGTGAQAKTEAPRVGADEFRRKAVKRATGWRRPRL